MRKFLKIIAILFGIIVLILAFFYFQFKPAQQFTWGLDFSQVRARELGFDAHQMYLDMLSDLRPKKVRLVAYWNEMERKRGEFDFKEVDEMLKLAQDYNAEVILVLGKKQPRWPECHQPQWVNELSAEEQNLAQLHMIKSAVEHFKVSPVIKIWQVENEPLFFFGDNCPKINRDFLKQEIALVKSLDLRPVLVTDSGEMGRWLPTATTGADLFGTTMYRLIYNPYTGYMKYPLPPGFFRIKAGILKTFTDLPPPLGVELQAEPWVRDGVDKTPVDIQKTLMNVKVLENNLEYAQNAGFSENYLWGVEWWYWMAKKHNDWGMWASVKDLLSE